MEEEVSDEICITIYFDNGNNVKISKSFLIEHSPYFEAMFCGKFMEAQSGDQIKLKDINYTDFMNIIKNLKHNHIVYENVEELLSLLETSQLLQFTDIIEESMNVINNRFVFTPYAVPIFSLASRLGLKELCDKSRIYILYNFKKLLLLNRDSFFELNEGDLQVLLNDNGLNVRNEIDVYDLVLEWCLKTNNYDNEYEMAVNCVHFSSMNKTELNSCISKTDNLNLKNTIKQYINCINENGESMELLIRPVRSIPNVLCAMKNENKGAYIYRWNWTSLKFTQFLKVDPLPIDTTGYHVIVKEMDVFVLAGEINFGRGVWNEAGWKYSLLSKQWTKLENFVPSKRRHGVGHFCGNELYLLGGLTKHRLANELIEKFRLENDTGKLARVKSFLCNSFTKRIDRSMYICLEYKGQLVLITKCNTPTWFELNSDTVAPPFFKWESRLMNLKAIAISAVTFLDNVYVLAYNEKNTVVLYCYFPMNQSCRELKTFKTAYNHDSTMCVFNINKAMVFGNNKLEYYCVVKNIYKEFTTQLDSFHSNYFFSIPIY